MKVSRFATSAVFFSMLWSATVQALQFEWEIGEGLSAVLNTRVEMGAQWRMEDRATHLVGKSNLNPDLCVNSCQGHTFDAGQSTATLLGVPLFGLDIPGEGPRFNQIAVDAPGAFSANSDDGNLNFDQYDVTQAVAKVTQDILVDYAGWSFFARYYMYHDDENYGRREFHPNVATPASVARNNAEIEAGNYGIATPGDPVSLRRNSVKNEQLGRDFRLLDFNLRASFPFVGDRELTVKVGRQPINWGESTVIIVNSLNTFNPPDQNALFRPAFLALEEVLVPVDAVSVATDIAENWSLEAFYQYDWESAVVPPPGSFLSAVDVGSDNAVDTINLGFGKVAEDPFRISRAEEALLTAVSDIRGNIPLLPEREPEDKGGQWGVALRYFADWLNNGTEVGFYAANYHSRLPYLSFNAAQLSCAANLAPTNDPLVGTLSLVNPAATAGAGNGCPDADLGRFIAASLAGAPAVGLPVIAAAVDASLAVIGPLGVGGDGTGPLGDAYPLSSNTAFLEYPSDIELYGVSFNTTFGDFSMQGEVAYRPNLPLQIDDIDLAFASLQPGAPNGCALPGSGCAPGSRDDSITVGLPGVPGVLDPLALANLAGRRHTFPDFVTSYRGNGPVQPGEYIQGFERFKVLQYNLGGTYIIGPHNWIFADQILLIGEVGATHVLDFPDLCELQLEGPGTFTHASAGADGTGTPSGPGRVCAAPGDSVYDAPSGVRFNPTQQDPDGFADDFSWGYRILAILRYPGVLPGLNLEPTILFADDVKGTAPGPGENFVEGRQNLAVNIQMFLGNSWLFDVGYTWFRGGEPYNTLVDRDYAQIGVRYSF